MSCYPLTNTHIFCWSGNTALLSMPSPTLKCVCGQVEYKDVVQTPDFSQYISPNKNYLQQEFTQIGE